jgi:transcription elongation factor GreA
MVDNKFFLTQEGVLELERELDFLKNTKRHEVIEKLQEARAQGDLSENADYDAARDEQAHVEGRIKEIENMLENYEIIDENHEGDIIVLLGSKVTIREVGEDEEEVYKIVGSTEADPLAGKISNESPIATAIMSRQVGEVVSCEAPGGVFDIEILAID